MFRLFNSFRKKEQIPEINEKFIISGSIELNIKYLRDVFNNDDTVIFREFETNWSTPVKCCVVFVDCMSDSKIIDESIIKPCIGSQHCGVSNKTDLTELFIKKILLTRDIKKENETGKIITSILNGSTILIIDGVKDILIMDSQKYESRAITEPVSESVVRGPREGFNEILATNISLIRRRIKTHKLKFQFKEIGYNTKTRICISYIEGLADEKILNEVNERISRIDIDAVLESEYIEELIQEKPFQMFRTIGSTERPDIIASKLLEGRIAILVDGTPYVLTMPFIFIEYFQSNEDYYVNYLFGTFNRLLRMGGFFAAISLTAIYVALITHHQEVIPTSLLLSISAAREGVPFPTIIEAVLVTLAFDLLRESGVKLPSPVGTTIGFVGAVILGQSAVTAKFASAPMIIVASITGISNFLVPNMLGPLIFIRLIFLIMAGVLGFYGYIYALIGLSIYLINMKSFGTPYMTGITSVIGRGSNDIYYRAPWKLVKNRPKIIGNKKS